MRKELFIMSFAALGGCATPPSATATCTDLVSTGGGLLKYCQTGRRIDVTESGVDPAADPPAVKIVDDPEVLSRLQREAGLRPEFSASRKLVTRACVAGGVDYITLSVNDIKRIMADRSAAPVTALGGEAVVDAPPK